MIYILGTERSASTWVANILDHHPNLDLYMEPLSSHNSRFKNWPNRFETISNYEKRAIEFKKEFTFLKRNRRFLLTHISDSPNAWRYDLKLAKFLIKKNLAPDSVIDFLETNYHRNNRQLHVKKQKPLHTVIKEVRLNFNASLISKVEDGAKVLVTIREMASCVRSMQRQLEKGNLTDLRNDLQLQYGSITVEILSRYWFESYSSLLETLKNQNIPFILVSHTELIQNRIEVSEKIFRFLEVEFTAQVRQYLEMSNKPGSGKHSTERKSNDLLEQIQTDRNYIHPMAEKEIKKIRAHPVLKKFIGDL